MGGPRVQYGPNDLLNTGEAAAVLGLAERTFRRWRYKGKTPPYVKIGGSIRFRYGVLMEWISSHEHRPPVPPPPPRPNDSASR